MKVLGLTGSIGMGKSEAARVFRRLGVSVFDADEAVHRIYAKGGAAVKPVGDAFPGSAVNGAIDRQRLREKVLHDSAALKKLEAIVHPLVARERKAFLRRARRRGAKLAVLDIPLLFETGGDRYCDATAAVTCPAFLQRQRVLSRPGMSEDAFRRIVSAQLPDREKRRRADYVIPTGLDKRAARDRILRLKRKLSGKVPARKMQEHGAK